MRLTENVLTVVRRVVREVPPSTLRSIITLLEERGGQTCDEAVKSELLRQAPTPQFRRLIKSLADTWCQSSPKSTCYEIAAALETGHFYEQSISSETAIELVWTGPYTKDVALRRTEQALLQLIQESTSDLTVISFAVYNIPQIVDELTAAIARGVSLRIIVETPDASTGKISFGAHPAFGDEIVRRAQIYEWARDKRPTDAKGKHGSLHVKCATADGTRFLMSSANLTRYALTLNMEMGLLVRNKQLTAQINEHIDGLVLQRILVRV